MSDIACEHCGKIFRAYPYQHKKGKGRFCSNECRNAARKTNFVVRCRVCGEEFRVFPYQYRSGLAKYCSRKCSDKHNIGSKATEETRLKMMASARRGPAHHSWKGGTARERYPKEFNEILKDKIREYYHYACQECDKTEDMLMVRLHIHHIDYDKTNNKIENLIPLCNSCHSKTNGDREYWAKRYTNKRR